MLLLLAVTVIALWLIVMTVLMLPNNFFHNQWDKLTHGKYNKDKPGLQLMLDHLRSFPDEWTVDKDMASFPAKGNAKQIYLSHTDKGWEYTLNSRGSKATPLEGHFGREYTEVLAQENARRQSLAFARTLFPDLDGPLLLANGLK